MSEESPYILSKLFPYIFDSTVASVQASLHTGGVANPPAVLPEDARLFLVDAAGKRHECTRVSPVEWFGPGETIIARHWELWSELEGGIAEGDF